MAKVHAPFELSGMTFDSVFCRTEFGNILKGKGGATPWQVANKDTMENTRRINRDFKRATKAAQLMRNALGSLIDSVNNAWLCGRVNGLMHNVVKTDMEHHWGDRRASCGDLSLVAGFEFNQKLDLDDALPLNISDCYSVEGGKVQLNMPAFRVRKKKCLPAKATHYRMVSCVLSIDFDKKKYVCNRVHSELYAMGRKAGGAFAIEQEFLTDQAQGCLWIVGIEFYKLVQEKPVLVKGGALRVMEWVPQDVCGDTVGEQVGSADVTTVDFLNALEPVEIVTEMCDGVECAEFFGPEEVEVCAGEALVAEKEELCEAVPGLESAEEVEVCEMVTGPESAEEVEVCEMVTGPASAEEVWERALADAERINTYAEAIWESAFGAVENAGVADELLRENVGVVPALEVAPAGFAMCNDFALETVEAIEDRLSQRLRRSVAFEVHEDVNLQAISRKKAVARWWNSGADEAILTGADTIKDSV
ncbi:hypothetical protein [Paraflavitalea sp. CAU 1676]|uniref:hypothetical protein n=1 Tax=Paraflavitalea sp. CAU 1676 TaxID=3032598 RepID=UPI0023DA0D24|nr:hypothetical protein [Paraflavitalea sp. CAU 1676]MDF2192088.1 hypothetical protein [Paraflavitalea sp. CAU 1676]